MYNNRRQKPCFYLSIHPRDTCIVETKAESVCCLPPRCANSRRRNVWEQLGGSGAGWGPVSHRSLWFPFTLCCSWCSCPVGKWAVTCKNNSWTGTIAQGRSGIDWYWCAGLAEGGGGVCAAAGPALSELPRVGQSSVLHGQLLQWPLHVRTFKAAS